MYRSYFLARLRQFNHNSWEDKVFRIWIMLKEWAKHSEAHSVEHNPNPEHFI